MNLDRTIIILRATTTTNDLNEPVVTWNEIAMRSSAVTEVPDGERWRAMEVSADISTRFVVRWDSVTSTVDPKDRIAYKGRTYDINRVKETERNAWMEITASARAD